MLGIKRVFLTIFLIFFIDKISAAIIPTCNETTLEYMYPLSDPNLYYYCRDKYTPQILSCPHNYGFQYNEETVGCVPWVEWNCTYRGGRPSCKKGTEHTWTRHEDPSLYYGCSGINQPTLLHCPDGSGYSYTHDMVGCVPWDMWDCSKQIVY